MVKRILRVGSAAVFWTLVISVLWVILLRFVPPPVTWVMAQQSNEQGSVKRTWVPLSRIAHDMPLAVMASEDQKFFEHFGFDVDAMRDAMKYNDRKKGRRVKGASTISQQSSERGRAVKLAMADGKLTLSVSNPDSGSATEEIEGDYDAAPLEIGFNARYLLDIASQLESDTALLKLADPGSPTLIQDRDGASALYVLMPMRV